MDGRDKPGHDDAEKAGHDPAMRRELTFAIGLAVICGILLLAGYFLEWSPILLGLVIWLLVCADIWFLWLIRRRPKSPPVP